ncbi:hypothetical protein [Hyphomicrobium sp. CS1GBMeth3]|uniref:hypothetical protein n=1 Tax=Hyphomicrobium sp. CS1GBMeth3 TaxID=1892845 RepID=UPI0009311AD0|nr:hypothetical protein [Hyphomicrobium sp. CS1GBMeth3]
MGKAKKRDRFPSEETRNSRKLIAFEPDVLRALTLLAQDRMQDFQELADEAFRDLLKKHHRPVTLKESLKQSTRTPAND